MSPRVKLGLFVSVGSLLVVFGRASEAPLSATAAVSENCAPHEPLAPDVVERRCLSRGDLAGGEIRRFVARDVEVHLPSDRRCAFVLGFRVAEGEPAIELRVGPQRVVLEGSRERAVFVGPEALKIALVGEVLEVSSADGASKSEVSPIADRMGRIHVARHEGECADLSLVVDRLGG
jgi:hypothetical protein